MDTVNKPADVSQPVPDKPDEAKPDAPEKNTEDVETGKDEAKDSKPESRFGAAERKVKNAVSNFYKKHIKGERLPEEDQAGMSKADVAKTIGGGMMGAAASLGGIKSLIDVPRWFTQKYFTGQEKSRIQDAINTKESSEDSEGAPPSVEQKKKTIEKAVSESKYLSPEKKAELIKQLEATIEKYDAEIDTSEKEKNEAIAKLLDEAINTRVKGSTAIKETMNTALMATGLSALRGIGYGAVALYERGVKVDQEMEKGERKDSFAKELIVNGFKETIRALAFNEGATKREKVVNAAKAIGTVMRFVGFERMALAELNTDGMSGMIDKALETFEQKGALGAVAANAEHTIEKATFGLLGGDAKPSAEVSGDHAPQAAAEHPAQPEAQPAVAEPVKTEITHTESATESAVSHPDEVKTAEATADAEPTTETSKEDLDLATIRKGDGFIKIAKRQLEAHPDKFGFTGDASDAKAVAKWARHTANKFAVDSHLMNKHLTSEGIGKVAATLENHDGKLALHFLDANGKELPDDAYMEKPLAVTYEAPHIPKPHLAESFKSPETPATTDRNLDSNLPIERPQDAFGSALHDAPKMEPETVRHDVAPAVVVHAAEVPVAAVVHPAEAAHAPEPAPAIQVEHAPDKVPLVDHGAEQVAVDKSEHEQPAAETIPEPHPTHEHSPEPVAENPETENLDSMPHLQNLQYKDGVPVITYSDNFTRDELDKLQEMKNTKEMAQIFYEWKNSPDNLDDNISTNAKEWSATLKLAGLDKESFDILKDKGTFGEKEDLVFTIKMVARDNAVLQKLQTLGHDHEPGFSVLKHHGKKMRDFVDHMKKEYLKPKE